MIAVQSAVGFLVLIGGGIFRLRGILILVQYVIIVRLGS